MRKGLFTILFMFSITVIFISVLAVVYVLTRDRILVNESLFLKRAVLFAADLEVPESAGGVEEQFREWVKTIEGTGGALLYYEIVDPGNGQTVSYVLPVSGAGLWGEIEAVVGVEQDLQTLTGIDFTRQNETPGLGGRIVEDWFREQFRGKRRPFSTVPEGDPAGVQEFQAITGATYTVNGVLGILNERLVERLVEAEKFLVGN